jgi:hypothetical protein
MVLKGDFLKIIQDLASDTRVTKEIGDTRSLGFVLFVPALTADFEAFF